MASNIFLGTSAHSSVFTIGVHRSPGTFIMHVMSGQEPKYSCLIIADRKGEAFINYRNPEGGAQGPIMWHMFLDF